jgi:membrane associated rhomboid family serine protease
MIFFLSGITGSIASYGLHEQVLGVGASGAIFGLLGATIGYFLRQREKFGVFGQSYLRSLLGTAALNFALLLLIPGIDNLAHGGGLVGGFVLGYLCSPLYEFSQRPDGRLNITQRDSNSSLWIFFALAWLAIIAAVFFFFLNSKLA